MYVHDRIRTMIAPWAITTQMRVRVRVKVSLIGLRVGLCHDHGAIIVHD